MPHVVRELFEEIERARGQQGVPLKTFTVRLSMMEIYNEVRRPAH